jgi:capsular exopolysaccharide synthesis family protein
MTYSQPEKQIQKKRTKSTGSRCLITVLDPASVASEAYRALRTSLLYARVDTPPKVVLVTSPGSEEGKSTVCANLGVVLAQAGKRVLIVDCDFRRPVMHDIFGLGNARGVVNVLAGECQLQEAYQEPLPDLRDLQVLTVGAVPPNPAELLSSQRFAEVLHTVSEDFDYVLLDSSPTKVVSDPAIIAAQSDGVLLTFDAQKTRKGDVRRAVHALAAVGANILGTVMNNGKGSEEVYY